MKLSVPILVIFMSLASLAVACSSGADNEEDGDDVMTPGEPTPTPAVRLVGDETEIKLYLQPLTGVGQTGFATLISSGAQTKLDIDLSPPYDVAQPIHIHSGSCSDIGTVIEPLENVIRGRSATVVDRPLESLTTEGMLINVHASFDDFGTSTACVELFVDW